MPKIAVIQNGLECQLRSYLISAPTAEQLRTSIIKSLKKQGFRVHKGVLVIPGEQTKDAYRKINEQAVAKKRETAFANIGRHEEKLLGYIANGSDVDPNNILPRLVEVKPKTELELLFRYASLHWSIPVSSGYGRRLRFLVFDDNNGKLIGLFGLGDPVFALRARDQWIGWDSDARKVNLYHVMDAHVLGAVPPYSFLLCGKLIAMLALSNEVRETFRSKYRERESLISQRVHAPYLTLLTTTSALGRSSIYNRIKIRETSYWTSIGFTQGYGEFQFSDGIYDDIRSYVEHHCTATARNPEWGEGFRNRREVVKKCLMEIGLSTELMNHGIKREIFAAPLASNALRFLKGQVSRPVFHNWSCEQLAEMHRYRWLLKRAESRPEYMTFRREDYRLWKQGSGE